MPDDTLSEIATLADARLIAAAPAMLDALRLAYIYINGGSGFTPKAHAAAFHAVRAAIAKATGEAQP